MSGLEFHQTVRGADFFDHQLPKLIASLDRLSAVLEKLTDSNLVIEVSERRELEVVPPAEGVRCKVHPFPVPRKPKRKR